MKIVTTRKGNEIVSHGGRFSTQTAAEKYVTGLAESGRIDEVVSIETEAGPDLLVTVRGLLTDELALPFSERMERTINELKACVSLIRALRSDEVRLNTHRLLLDIVRGCKVGSAEAKEIYEAAEALLPSDEEG